MRTCFFCDSTKEEMEMMPAELEYQFRGQPTCILCAMGFKAGLDSSTLDTAVQRMHEAADAKVDRIRKAHKRQEMVESLWYGLGGLCFTATLVLFLYLVEVGERIAALTVLLSYIFNTVSILKVKEGNRKSE